MTASCLHTYYIQSTDVLAIDMLDKPLFWHEFSALNGLINAFVNNLPQTTAVTQGNHLDVLVACTVARVAVIQLHIRFAREQAASRDACLAAANAILATVQNLRADRVGYIDPIMAVSSALY